MRKYLPLALLILSLGLTVKSLFHEVQKVHSLRAELTTVQSANQSIKQGYEDRLANVQAALTQRERDMARLSTQNIQIKDALNAITTSNPEWGSTPVPADVVKRVCFVVKCPTERP